MPFKSKYIDQGHGGARTGAGRKSIKDAQGLQDLLDEIWTPAKRAASFKMAVADSINKTLDPKDRLAALRFLTEAKFGKPKQISEVSATVETTVLAPVANGLSKVYGELDTTDSDFETDGGDSVDSIGNENANGN